jgi:transcriptional regulator with XRE-family HTH domain
VLYSDAVQLRPPPNALPSLVERTDDSDILAYFGVALRSERVRSETTPQQLADRLGCARSALVMWETGRGKPRFTTLVRLIAIYPGLVDVLRDLATQLANEDRNGTAA